jgi:hypothetical protein
MREKQEKEKSSVHVAKPGSKLAQIQALGRRGGIHPVGGRSNRADGGPVIDSPSTAGPPPKSPAKTTVKPTSLRKAAVKPASHNKVKNSPAKTIAKDEAKPDKIKRARAALKSATEANGDGAKKRPGPSKGSGKVGKPWLALKPPISKAKYYRDLKAKET